jgi:hypothetical protein
MRFTQRTPWNILLVLALSAAIAGCRVKRVTERSPLVPLSDHALRVLLEEQRYDFETLSGKLNMTASANGQNNSFKANLRVRKDSALWLSLTPALGIEAARVLIDRDSVKYVDKINNQYYIGNYSFLDSILDYPAEFSFLTNLLVGNAVEIEKDEKYISTVDGLNYVLTTKNKRKVRKSVSQVVTGRDSISLLVSRERALQRAIVKFSDDDLIIKRYYMRPGDFRVERTMIEDLLMQRSLRVSYSAFEEVDGKAFPMRIVIDIITPGETSRFELAYTRVKINEPQTFPFKVPEKYSRIR